MVISQALQPRLMALGYSLNDFSELLIRLLDYGVLCRDESATEEALYDRFVSLEELVEDYLELMRVRLLHDRRFQYVRLYPPGAAVPGLPDEDQSPFNSGFRVSLNQHEVAVILALRAEYDKSLREGQVDEQGMVVLSMEALNIALRNLLNRSLPEKKTERTALFRRLRQLRLIQMNQDSELEQEDTWIRIRPMIMGFVNETILDQLSQPEAEVPVPGSGNTVHPPESSLFSDLAEE